MDARSRAFPVSQRTRLTRTRCARSVRGMPRILIVGSFLALPLLAIGPPAAGAITAEVSDGALQVTGTGQVDYIVVQCGADGDVAVNGDDPDTGPFPCADLTSIIVESGANNDAVGLDTIRHAQFPTLRAVTVRAGEGNDNITGTPGEDRIFGGSGVDVFVLVQGDDHLNGGGGDDVLSVSTRSNVTLSEGSLVTRTGRTTFVSVERAQVYADGHGVRLDARRFRGEASMSSNRGSDTLLGGFGHDVLSGGGGDDRLIGGAANDTIVGGPGDDVLRGGTGLDFLDGSTGHDDCDAGPGGGVPQNCE